MFIEGVVGSEPVLASVGPYFFIEPIEKPVLGGGYTFIPLDIS